MRGSSRISFEDVIAGAQRIVPRQDGQGYFFKVRTHEKSRVTEIRGRFQESILRS